MGDKSNNKDSRAAFWKLLHWVAQHVLARRFNYTYEPIECGGPCLIVSNHVTNYDPFFVGLAHKNSPLSYVASEHIFRQGFVSKLIIKLLDPIPRSKAASGAGTVKSCLRRIKNGESIALFAEGDCTWDGRSAEVFPATGKLAKVCGAPLITFRIEGGYLSSPRWANKTRRGKMHGAPVRVYGTEELKAMSPEEVTAAINRDIYTDAFVEQRERMIPFMSKAPAEGLERALFMCPECGGADCMASNGSVFRCEKCGAEWNMDECGFLHGPKFQTIAEWDEWQKQAIKDMKGWPLFPGSCVFTDINSGKGEKRELKLDSYNGYMVLYDDKFQPIIKFLSRIDSMAMVKTNRLLFEDYEGYYEIKSKRGVLRPYLMLWQALHNNGEE